MHITGARLSPRLILPTLHVAGAASVLTACSSEEESYGVEGSHPEQARRSGVQVGKSCTARWGTRWN